MKKITYNDLSMVELEHTEKYQALIKRMDYKDSSKTIYPEDMINEINELVAVFIKENPGLIPHFVLKTEPDKVSSDDLFANMKESIEENQDFYSNHYTLSVKAK